MKSGHVFLTILIAAVVAGGVAYLAPGTRSGESAVKESAYDRVLRTGVLRCGYADWPPYVFTKDPATGKVSGILADVTETMAAKLSLKVDWSENTGWGSYIEALRTGRIDAFCAGSYRNAEKGRYLAYTVPVFYNAVYPYVRVDDHRFDKDLSVVNDPGVRISTMDGEISDMIAKAHFPKATAVSVPQLGQGTDIFVNIAAGKADIVFNEPSITDDYIKNNPGTLRRAGNVPFQTYPTCLDVDIHEMQLRDMLDSALIELQNAGLIEKIISKYSSDPKVFLRAAKPYESGS
ncbi:MAG: transporter substrate-binding domain-containing protein [Alphaproteobacteria bacterium]|nr:transporter substrate-binding domain-containing protein [Alphaproteobacteria bacterium]